MYIIDLNNVELMKITNHNGRKKKLLTRKSLLFS